MPGLPGEGGGQQAQSLTCFLLNLSFKPAALFSEHVWDRAVSLPADFPSCCKSEQDGRSAGDPQRTGVGVGVGGCSRSVCAQIQRSDL